MSKINIYIDGNNLYRSAKKLGFDIDYKKFRGWLRQKYSTTNVYLFAELVLKTTSDFYTKAFDTCILITGDGDFGCLVEFLEQNMALSGVIAPDEKKCSILLKNKNISITFLNDHYHKFSKIIKVSKWPK